MIDEITATRAALSAVAEGTARERVVASVADVLCRHGLWVTDLELVAEEAGVCGAWLREQFTDVEALVAEAVRVQVRAVFAKPGRGLRTVAGPSDLHRWGDGVVDGYRATRTAAGYPLGILVHELLGCDGSASEALAANLGPWQSALEHAFTRLRDRGELGAGACPVALATAVMGMLVGAMGRSRTADTAEGLLDPFELMLRHVLSGAGR